MNDILGRVALMRERVSDAGVTEQLTRSSIRPVSQSGGFVEKTFSIADLLAASGDLLDLPSTNFGVAIAVQGTTKGVSLKLGFNSGNSIGKCRPGCTFVGAFNRLTIEPDSDCIQAGTVRLILFQNPEVRFFENADGADNEFTSDTSEGPGGLSLQAAATASGAGNKPTAPSDGIALSGKGVISGSVYATSDVNLTGGVVRVWFYDDARQAWGRSPIVLTIEAGVRLAILDDVTTQGNFSRVYLEAADVTVSAATTLTVAVYFGAS